jgi:hypothetical protein
LDIFNNVVYNWRSRTTDGGAHEVNFVNNYYKPGAATTLFTALNPQYGGFPGTQQYYMSGNVMPGKFDESNQAAGFTISTENGGTLPQNSTPPYTATVGAAFFPSHATIHTAANAYKQVLSNVGCNQPMIDNHDTRLITETLNGSYTYTGSVSGRKGLPDTTNDVGGWENYGTAARPANWDSDHDGMPNWWETALGLDVASPAGDFSESNADPDGNGYTNLEEYLNWMAAPNADCSATVDVDLGKLSRGYTSSPVYTLSGPVNGTVAIVGGNKARFTASDPNSAALGSFNFTVTDSAGDAMTRTVGVRILGPGGISAQAVPTGLAAAANASQVVLNWTASPGATSYNVKRSTTSGDPYPVTIALPVAASHVDSGLADGIYHYVVSAVGPGGESGDTAQVSVTVTSGVPAAPTGLTAIAGNTQVSLSWSAVPGALSYNVKRATASGGPYTIVASSSGPSHVNTGLTNGTAYHFVVSAVGAGGEGANSAQASATPIVISSPTTIQAESGTAGGGTAFEQGSSSNSGWNGTGYANFPVTGGSLQFANLNGGAGGTATLAIRFTVGGTTSRTGNLMVNGISQPITFPTTSAWNNWTILTVSIPLASGSTNTLRFESNGQDLANLDELTITPAAAVPITISANDATAGEFGPDTVVEFTVVRVTSSTATALTVPITASGSASAGSDYSGYTTTVTIPAGQGSVVVPLTVLPDSVAEGPETVTLTVGEGAGVVAGTPASASATIADNPSQGYFFTAIADPAKRGPNDDADGDSNANVVEYFMGSDPDSPGSLGVLTIPAVGESTFKVRYPRAKNRQDVSGSLRWSSDTVNWFAGGQSDGTRTINFTDAVVSEPAADPETVEATAIISGTSSEPAIFVRLAVQ